MDWTHWYKHYDATPRIQARLRVVQRQIIEFVNECPAGPITIVSVCSGDGRDLVGALADHPRRNGVAAWLLDAHADTFDRGKEAARAAGLERQLHFVLADATRADSYRDIVPADLVLISGVLGHLRPDGVASLLSALPMLCKPGGGVILNRGLLLNDGARQVPAIRQILRSTGFEEMDYEVTSADGFACLRARLAGPSRPLDTDRVLFEFVGLDRLAGLHTRSFPEPLR
jgi:SAM-dependent methyltransferase